MNKREFVLGACATAASGAALACPAAAPTQVGQSGLRLKRLPDLATDMHSSAWQSYLGDHFTVGSLPMTLREIKLSDGAAANQALEQFTLVFSADAAAALPTGTQTLRHGSGQRVPLYLDAVPAAEGLQASYFAHFSLLPA